MSAQPENDALRAEIRTQAAFAGSACVGHRWIADYRKYEGNYARVFGKLPEARFRAVQAAQHHRAQVKAKAEEQFAWRALWSNGGRERPIDFFAGGSPIRKIGLPDALCPG